MYLAHIAPTSVLQTEVFKHLDFHLCLASQVLRDVVYEHYFRNASGFVILDVPTREEKDRDRPYSLDKLYKAIELVQPNEVTLPDVWGADSEVSIKVAYEAAVNIGEMRPIYSKRGSLDLLAVPRGLSYQEYTECAAEMTQIPGVKTLGIVDGTYEKFKIDRERIVTDFHERFVGVNLHLLGVKRDLSDIQNPRIRARVRSADTSKLVKFGLSCKHPIYHNIPDYEGRGENYFEQQVSEIQLSFVAKNVKYWNALVDERR